MEFLTPLRTYRPLENNTRFLQHLFRFRGKPSCVPPDATVHYTYIYEKHAHGSARSTLLDVCIFEFQGAPGGVSFAMVENVLSLCFQDENMDISYLFYDYKNLSVLPKDSLPHYGSQAAGPHFISSLSGKFIYLALEKRESFSKILKMEGFKFS